ncbi:MAG: hypothetical protein IKK60_03800 [Clostridia bacterium]|nr:hypothetical protein [Clostridia bacterium]
MSKLSHALIFEGADEATRLSAAKEVAAALVCKGEDKPCKSCNACLKALKDSHPDIHILFKEKDSTMIKVDAVREIKTQALIFPNEGTKSVFIISEAQYMNPQAQNALLKIFEEPSSHVCFILTCTSKSSLLDTVISRATSYTLGEGLASSEKGEDDKAVIIAAELISSLVGESEFDFLKKTASFIKDKKLFREVIERMISFSRDALILQSGGKELLNGEREEVRLLKNRFTQKKTFELTESLKSLSADLDSSANLNLTVTRFSSVLYGIKVN